MPQNPDRQPSQTDDPRFLRGIEDGSLRHNQIGSAAHLLLRTYIEDLNDSKGEDPQTTDFDNTEE